MNDELLQEAARRSVDQDRLLPGEQRDLRSKRPVDAEHWASIYAELVAFKVDIRQRTEASLKAVQEAGRPEIQNDLLILLAEELRLVRRHEFWIRRLEDLRGIGGVDEAARRETSAPHLRADGEG